MAPALTIGFLMPYSGIYPHYSAHLMTGWLLGMGLDPARQRTVQFVPEYTGQGSGHACEEAARKLLFFHRADVLSGLISYKSVPGMVPIIEADNKPAFFFDMGEYVPNFPYLSPDIFYASHQFWQSQYALGHWAYRTFGAGGHMVMPVYEAGYHLDNAFQQGVAAAGGSTLRLTVLPFDPNEPSKLELGDLFATWKTERPAYVHVICCGRMGTRFLKQWVNSGLHKEVPLLVQEAMAYDDMLGDISEVSMELYTAQRWLREDQSNANRVFVKTFEEAARQPANIYALMGYEAGLAWREVLPMVRKRDWDGVKRQLREGTVRGPAGERNFYPTGGLTPPITNILKVRLSDGKINKLIIDQGKGVHFDAHEVKAIHDGSVTGWQNPFLCI